MNRFVTDVVGALLESWAELRINRMRVLLSLVGVAVAIASLTGVVAAGELAGQASREGSERSGGRLPTYSVTVQTSDGGQVDSQSAARAFTDITRRQGIDFATQVTYGSTRVQFPFGVSQIATMTVDVPYAQIHRVRMDKGRWFTEADAQLMAPAVVVNEAMFAKMDDPDLAGHPTLRLDGDDEVTAVVIGVIKSSTYDSSPQIYLLPSGEGAGVPTLSMGADAAPTTFEMWLPMTISDELAAVVRSGMQASLGNDVTIDTNRQDYLQGDAIDPLRMLTLVVAGVAVLILLLGGMGLVNVSLVTVQQRIRDIGIRRAFGATAPRVFFSVILESVAGTAVAGVVGVMLAVFVVSNPLVRDRLAQGGVSDLPAFPLDVAVIGLAAAIAVGALAGLIPALVAIRVKVIDAIRY